MDYKNKYNKYKNKYLQLKQNLYGGINEIESVPVPVSEPVPVPVSEPVPVPVSEPKSERQLLSRPSLPSLPSLPREIIFYKGPLKTKTDKEIFLDNIVNKLRNTISSGDNQIYKDELLDKKITCVDFRFRGIIGSNTPRILVEVYGYKIANVYHQLDLPIIFYRSSGTSRTEQSAGVYFPSAFGSFYLADIYMPQVVSINNDNTKLIIYTVIGDIPKLIEQDIRYEFLKYLINKDPSHTNDKKITSEILIEYFSKDKDNGYNKKFDNYNKYRYKYLDTYDITLQSLFDYGRLGNKLFASISYWLNHNDKIIDSFVEKFNSITIKETHTIFSNYESNPETFLEIIKSKINDIFNEKNENEDFHYKCV